MSEGLSTRCVHDGEIEDAHGSPHTPIHNTTTFKLPSTVNQAPGLACGRAIHLLP